MSSNLARKGRYVKDRCVNAYWMLRGGKFRLILKSVRIELDHRATIIYAWLFKAKALDESQVPGSVFINRRRVVPSSYRPTKSETASPVSFQADPKIVANELRCILSTFDISEKE